MFTSEYIYNLVINILNKYHEDVLEKAQKELSDAGETITDDWLNAYAVYVKKIHYENERFSKLAEILKGYLNVKY